MTPKITHLLIVASLLLSPAIGFSAKNAKPEKPETKVVGSIRPKGKFKSADLPALTKITFDQALKAAVETAPGSVIKAELEIEDGNLMYSFEIVSADKKITEVEIDAGDGKVLDVDRS